MTKEHARKLPHDEGAENGDRKKSLPPQNIPELASALDLPPGAINHNTPGIEWVGALVEHKKGLQSGNKIPYQFGVDLTRDIEHLLTTHFKGASSDSRKLADAIKDGVLELQIDPAKRGTTLTASLLSPDEAIAELNDLPFTVAYRAFVKALTEKKEIPQFSPIQEYDGKRLLAVDFYLKFWMPYNVAGFLFRDTLKDYDPKVMPAVRNYRDRKGFEDLETFLPAESFDRHVRVLRSCDPCSLDFEDAAMKIGERVRARRKIAASASKSTVSELRAVKKI